MSGTVKDTQGAVVPGVTVTAASDALIGGPRTTVTNETGSYQFQTLPTGMFQVTFELTGFVTLKREGVGVQVAQNARVDAELQVGSLQESVTVTGASPVVDVLSTTTQTNIPKDMFEAIPTSRNPWVMAGLVAGVVTCAARRRRHAGDAAVQHRGVRLRGQSEDVFG